MFAGVRQLDIRAENIGKSAAEVDSCLHGLWTAARHESIQTIDSTLQALVVYHNCKTALPQAQ